MTAGPHRDRSSRPQNAAATGTSGIAIRYPMSVASPAGCSPPASLATMMPSSTSSRISRTPSAASKITLIRRFRAVISSAYPASARPATMIVVETAPFTDDMLLRFVVSGPAQARNQQERDGGRGRRHRAHGGGRGQEERDRARDERSDGLPEHHAVHVQAQDLALDRVV